MVLAVAHVRRAARQGSEGVILGFVAVVVAAPSSRRAVPSNVSLVNCPKMTVPNLHLAIQNTQNACGGEVLETAGGDYNKPPEATQVGPRIVSPDRYWQTDQPPILTASMHLYSKPLGALRTHRPTHVNVVTRVILSDGL